MKQVLITLLSVVSTVNSFVIDQSTILTLANASLDVSSKCEQHLSELVSNFSFNQNSWALQMFDATSKLQSGLLSLNFGEMGDFEQCINVNVNTEKSGTILGKYCLGSVSFSNLTESLEKTMLSSSTSFGDLSNIAQRTGAQGPAWALCVPNGCTTEDFNLIGNYLLANLSIQGLQVEFSDMLCQTSEDVNQEITTGAALTIAILALLLCTVIISTLYDIYCEFYSEKSCHLIVKAFSVYSNGKKVFKITKQNSDQLPCLNGLKFISMMWVVAGHQYSVTINGPITNTKYLMEWTDYLYSMFLVSGTLSVDTFLTIGGALMSYGFMKAKQKNVPFNVFVYYLHRYIRLTPPLAVVVLVSSTLLAYMGSGPKWPYVKLYFQENCVDYWWSALLYVQNYVNVSKMCVGQTWYLSIDMQLYLISPLVFFVLWNWPKFCMPLLGLCALGFMGASFYIAWVNDLTAILSNFYGNFDNFSNKYYLLTHTRAAPWVIGVILGYYIYKIKQNEVEFKLNKKVALVLWAGCLATMLVCVLGGHSTLRSKEYDRFGNSFHIALVRPVWSIAISWIILACTSNFGGPVNWILSLPIYQVLNRFTYSIYLTHVTMLYVIMYGKKWPDYFSDFNMAYQFWGTLWFSTGLAVLLVFSTESPMIIIEKMILGALIKKKTPRKDPERGIDNESFE